MQDYHENVERDFMTVDVGQWTLKTLLYCLQPVYTMIITLDKITTYIHTYIHIHIYIYIEDNKYYLNNIMEKVIPKSKTKFLQNFL